MHPCMINFYGMTGLVLVLLTMQLKSTNKWMKIYNGNKRLGIYYQNIPGTLSTNNVHVQIDTILKDVNPDILGVAEPDTDTMLNNNWPGYHVVKGTINGQIKKLRLHVLIKDNIKYELETWDLDMPTVVLRMDNLRVIMTYREWSKGGDMTTKTPELQERRWDQFVNKLAGLRGKIDNIVYGDMNYDYWVDSTQYQRGFDGIRNNFKCKLVSKGWTQWVTDNTRYQQGQAPSCIDHIYARTDAAIVEVVNKDIISYDHHCVGTVMHVSNKLFSPIKIERRDISGIPFNDFVVAFYRQLPDEIYGVGDTDVSLDMFCHKLRLAMNETAPKRIIYVKTKTQAMWMTRDLLDMRHFRQRLRSVALLHDTPIDWRNYRVYRNYLNVLMYNRKCEWITQQVTNSDPNDTWKAVKRIGDSNVKRSSDICVLDDNGRLLEKPKEVAEFMNSFFLRKVERIKETTPINPAVALSYTREMLGDRVIPEMEFTVVTPADVEKIISSLKNTKAVGVDDVPTELLKRFKSVLAPYITHIVNRAIYTSTYPSMWKTGIVSPVPKKGDLKQPGNWRPVTLLCTMSKVCETILNKQIKNHMVRHGLLSPHQHAYQNNKSCVTAWSDMDVFINRALDKNKIVCGLLLDMSAAFNLVSKHIIVPKLKLLGLGDYAARLVNSYLTGRRNVTKIKSEMSSWVEVTTGIGEGSVLGPLIFILTIICLKSVLERIKVRLQAELGVQVSTGLNWEEGDIVKLLHTIFADDVTPLCACDTEEQAKVVLDIFLDEYSQYFSSHGLKINVTKCEHILFTRQSRPRNVKMDNRQEATHVKLLGVTVSNNYTFDKHASSVSTRMNYRLGYLAKIKPYVTPEKFKMIAEAMSLSIMRYGQEIYCSTPTVQHKVQKAQNSLMRLVCDADRREEVVNLLSATGWVNAKISQGVAKLMLLRSMVIHRSSRVVMDELTAGQLQAQHEHNVRARQWQIAWRARYHRQAGSYLPSTVKLFNDLGLNRTGLGSKVSFKAMVREKCTAKFRNTNL